MNPPPRLAIILSHPTQYYSPWFRWIAAHTDVDLKVFYLWESGVTPTEDRQFGQTFSWDVDLLSGYEHEFVPNIAKRPGSDHFWGLRNPDLSRRLRVWRPDAVLLFGYAYFTHLRLLSHPPAPVIFRGDSHLLGTTPPGGIKRLLLRLIYRQCAAFLTVGQANTRYFCHYGVPAHKLFPSPHCVDAARFAPTPESRAEAAAQRRSLGIPVDAPVALFAGKFTRQKRPDLLIAAFLRAAVPNSHLVLAGSGEMTAALHALAGNRPDIHFLPFANQAAMPSRYLAGDVFVLPSQGRYETWGLAVNEAMHAGLGCIVSDQVGCHLDLIGPGWVFPAGDEAALAAALQTALRMGRDSLAVLGRQAQIYAASFSYEAAVSGLLKALEHVVPSAAPSAH